MLLDSVIVGGHVEPGARRFNELAPAGMGGTPGLQINGW